MPWDCGLEDSEGKKFWARFTIEPAHSLANIEFWLVRDRPELYELRFRAATAQLWEAADILIPSKTHVFEAIPNLHRFSSMLREIPGNLKDIQYYLQRQGRSQLRQSSVETSSAWLKDPSMLGHIQTHINFLCRDDLKKENYELSFLHLKLIVSIDW